MASSGSGAVVGGLMVASARPRARAGRTLIIWTIAYAITISFFAVSPSVWLSMPILLVAGLLGSYSMSSNNAMVQHLITDDVRGRVMGTYMLTWGLMPLSALPMGLAAEAIGIQASTVVGAGFVVVFTLLLAYRNRVLLRL
jgi:hypothetical protein